MRVIVTGQVGMEKKAYLQRVAEIARERGERLELFHVGDLMYAEAPGIPAGRILDLPLARLQALRRAAFKDILAASASGNPNAPGDAAGSEGSSGGASIVNTHATFRWRHGLFAAFDFDQMRLLAPDLFICLLDNIEVVHHRLHREHTLDATLKDLMVWREEEIMATELLANALAGRDRFFVLSRGRHADTAETCFRLIRRPRMKKVYASFPMSHVADLPEVVAEIDGFRAELARRFICFDPGDVDEKLLLDAAIAAAKDGRDFVESRCTAADGTPERLRVSVKQVLDIAGDIDGQIYARDFLLIDQSDMIVSLIPELPGGVPALSSGVERELHHAFEHGKEVYVVWRPRKNPSPFITETATKVFASVEEALNYFEDRGMFHAESLWGM